MRGLSAFAAIFGMLPGFVLPFVVSLVFSSQDADAYLITFAVSLTLWNVVVNNLELNTIGEVGRRIAADPLSPLDRGAIRNYSRRSLIYSLLVSVPVGVGLVCFYGLGLGFDTAYLAAGLLSVTVAVVGSISSVYSGVLIASSRSALAVGTQGIRGLFALTGCFLGVYYGIWVVPAFMVVGEALRCTILRKCSSSLIGTRLGSTPMSLDSVGWQSASTAVAQGSPVIARVFLTNSPSGAVAAYEIADKIFFALIQFMNLSLLVKLVGKWSTLQAVAPDKRRGVVAHGLHNLAAATSVASIVLCAILSGTLYLNVLPEEWSEGASWGLLLLACAPFAMTNSAYGRIVILIGKQKILIYFALLSVVVNVALDVVLFYLFGPLGIVVASGLVKLVSVAAYALYFRQAGWRVLESMEHSQAQLV